MKEMFPATPTDNLTEAMSGDFVLNADKGEFWFMCPCGCQNLYRIPISQQPQRDNPKAWKWDGNVEKPTLHPSIHNVKPCGWHGWLKGGIWYQA